ncbi:hypothetical protein OROMI_004841 [Orobanche minor]
MGWRKVELAKEVGLYILKGFEISRRLGELQLGFGDRLLRTGRWCFALPDCPLTKTKE